MQAAPQNIEEMFQQWMGMANMFRDASMNMANVPSGYVFVPPTRAFTQASNPPSEVSSVSASPITMAGGIDAAAGGENPHTKLADEARPLSHRREGVNGLPVFNHEGSSPYVITIGPSRSPTPSIASSDTSPTAVAQEPVGGSQSSSFAVPPPEIPAPLGEKHERYYFDDDKVTFRVDGKLFRVHRFFFERDSAVFRDVLLKDSDPQSRVGVVDLLDCTAIDFERFLDVLYPISFSRDTPKTLDEWTSILALSTQWGFNSIRTLATRELFPLASPIDKIVLAHKYDIKEWLLEAYKDVCLRKEPLSVEEAERIGVKDTARIASIRENRLCTTDKKRTKVSEEEKIRVLIQKEFSLECGTGEQAASDVKDILSQSAAASEIPKEYFSGALLCPATPEEYPQECPHPFDEAEEAASQYLEEELDGSTISRCSNGAPTVLGFGGWGGSNLSGRGAQGSNRPRR
ncbi:hypothetical protein NEOLEDRAFT_1131229 [Neolentinus lepideus HHB14362 ss-1]|uniref:BTB domain-containing protein n=1 Tax=Neolentinus lepideus HHB14362 ss-1 TaxID=1314782 RepID=A0A165TUK3_9AGAM|nr:hypothetical protein NEOLEDRAFT_1131229 [Neolentinus lepideus HHB14362 ss-1]